MRALRAFLRPSWVKARLAAVLYAVYLSTAIQGYAFSPFGPKPKLYDVLSPLGLWPAGVVLFAPFHATSGLLQTLASWRPPNPLEYAGAALYSLLFAWLFVFAHERGGLRLYRPGLLALPLVPVVLLFLLAHTWPESHVLSGASLAVSGVVFTALVLAAYVYLGSCLIRSLTRSSWWSARWGRAQP